MLRSAERFIALSSATLMLLAISEGFFIGFDGDLKVAGDPPGYLSLVIGLILWCIVTGVWSLRSMRSMQEEGAADPVEMKMLGRLRIAAAVFGYGGSWAFVAYSRGAVPLIVSGALTIYFIMFRVGEGVYLSSIPLFVSLLIFLHMQNADGHTASTINDTAWASFGVASLGLSLVLLICYLLDDCFAFRYLRFTSVPSLDLPRQAEAPSRDRMYLAALALLAALISSFFTGRALQGIYTLLLILFTGRALIRWRLPLVLLIGYPILGLLAGIIIHIEAVQHQADLADDGLKLGIGLGMCIASAVAYLMIEYTTRRRGMRYWQQPSLLDGQWGDLASPAAAALASGAPVEAMVSDQRELDVQEGPPVESMSTYNFMWQSEQITVALIATGSFIASLACFRCDEYHSEYIFPFVAFVPTVIAYAAASRRRRTASPAMGAPFAVLGRVIPLLVVVLATIYGIVLALKYKDYKGAPAILAVYGIALLPMGVNELIFSGLFQLLCGDAPPGEDDAPRARDREGEASMHPAAPAPAAHEPNHLHQDHAKVREFHVVVRSQLSCGDPDLIDYVTGS